MAQLLFLQSENDRTPVHMYINSPGDLIKIKGTFKHTVANYCCNVGKNYLWENQDNKESRHIL